ncbi:hypothetical protein Ccrd_018590 [Cynara cardunculus var. scolymus]|uniref:Uncharacterized protein n=1 Tax=Cynara cardunculus var. scolymus TaxID=59895 RepID=A0A103Y5W7_CYNCS|nr:hypothetical protein Ccrd_018590 [Cynara cardunculus var. scolymus]
MSLSFNANCPSSSRFHRKSEEMEAKHRSIDADTRRGPSVIRADRCCILHVVPLSLEKKKKKMGKRQPFSTF